MLSSDEIRKYSKSHPCPECKKLANRIPSPVNFAFKGASGSDPTSGRSSSGSHDLDYPSLDKAIGRSSNRKWKEYDARKAERDRVRREVGTNAISVGPDGSISATDPKTLDAREKGLKLYKKARQTAS